MRVSTPHFLLIDRFGVNRTPTVVEVIGKFNNEPFIPAALRNRYRIKVPNEPAPHVFLNLSNTTEIHHFQWHNIPNHYFWKTDDSDAFYYVEHTVPVNDVRELSYADYCQIALGTTSEKHLLTTSLSMNWYGQLTLPFRLFIVILRYYPHDDEGDYWQNRYSLSVCVPALIPKDILAALQWDPFSVAGFKFDSLLNFDGRVVVEVGDQIVELWPIQVDDPFNKSEPPAMIL
jgi:hypothetical protein